MSVLCAFCSVLPARNGLFCRKHGGGRRCSICGSLAVKSGLCSKHVIGKKEDKRKKKQCKIDLCTNLVVSRSLCNKHGGGRRCMQLGGCDKSVKGTSSFCVKHGGGRRCQELACNKSAQGITNYCTKHSLNNSN